MRFAAYSGRGGDRLAGRAGDVINAKTLRFVRGPVSLLSGQQHSQLRHTACTGSYYWRGWLYPWTSV